MNGVLGQILHYEARDNLGLWDEFRIMPQMQDRSLDLFTCSLAGQMFFLVMQYRKKTPLDQPIPIPNCKC